MSDTSQSSPTTAEIVKDIFLWRRRNLSLSVLSIATAMWVVLDVYQFTFVTVASWVAMFVVSSLFLWGNILRLLGKEPPSLSELEITEQRAMEMANSFRRWIEEGVSWMFRVGVESDWFVFAGVEAGLFLLSIVGSYFDLLILLYIGTGTGMTIPPIYVKYEDKIKSYEEGMKMQWGRLCQMVDEKVLKKMKSKIVEVRKEKKVE